jgi:hypothetical protein
MRSMDYLVNQNARPVPIQTQLKCDRIVFPPESGARLISKRFGLKEFDVL